MHYVGIDWATDKHDVCLMGEDGRVLSEFSVPHSEAGFRNIGTVLEALDDKAIINIERCDGLLVDWLVGHDFVVYVTSPVVVAHRRPRRSKDDRGDAFMLAHLLRVKDPECRPLVRQSATVVHLRQLVKAYEDVLQEQRREANRLIWLLREYFPAALKAFRVRHSELCLAFLEAYPSPRAAQALTVDELSKFLVQHRSYKAGHLNVMYSAFQERYSPASAEEGYVEVLQLLIPRLRCLVQQRKQLHRRITQLFKTHPEASWWRSLPGANGPLTPARLLAAVGDDRQRFPSVQVLQATAGTVPVTRRSNKQVSVEFREGCSKPLRKAVGDLARHSIKYSGWARSYLNDQLAHGHSGSRAYRALGNRWLAIIWKLWQTGEAYSEVKHVANRSRRGQPLRHESALQVISA